MAREDTQVNVRLPAELLEQLRHAASYSGKSLTLEIVDRLVDSFPATLDEIAVESLRNEAVLLSAHATRLQFDARAHSTDESEWAIYQDEIRAVDYRMAKLTAEMSELLHQLNEARTAKKAETSVNQ